MNSLFQRHCCPQCGHYVGWQRIYLGSPLAVWNCEACGIPLTASSGSRWLIMVSGLSWIVLIVILASAYHLIHWRGVLFLALLGGTITANLVKVVIWL